MTPRQVIRAVGAAIKRGDLVRGPCEVCGTAKTVAHHDDYEKPLEVRWLCHSHHHEAHGRTAFTTRRKRIPENYKPTPVVLHRVPGQRVSIAEADIQRAPYKPTKIVLRRQ
jgi:hypothetical protein